MNLRSFALGLGCLAVLSLGCGGEGASSPPPEVPPMATDAPKSDTPAEKPADTTATNGQMPPPASTTTTNSTPPESTAKPVANDKPVAPEKKPEPAAPSDVPGANISVGRLEADGLVTKDIQCKSEGSGGGLGLLGAVLVTAWMSPLKKSLDACAASESETRVIWKASGGKVTGIEAKGDAKVKACVEKVLRPGKPVFEGHCAATVVHGKK